MNNLAKARAIVKAGDYDTLQLLYDDIPDTLSQLIRTAFVPRLRYKFIVSDFSAIEARVDLKAVCEQMGRPPDWMPDILRRANGYETEFYKKD